MSGFQLSSEVTQRRVLVFHDERELKHNWLYHGVFVVEASSVQGLSQFLSDTRKQSGSQKDVHFVDLNGRSCGSKTTKLAALWARAAFEELWTYCRFYLLGVALSNLDRSVFGNDKRTVNQNIYNRFFEIALFSALRWFYPNDFLKLIQAFSEERSLAGDNPFQRRPLYRIERRETNITCACGEITLVKKRQAEEKAHPNAVPCIQLVDVLMGGISQCYDRSSSRDAHLEIEDILREPLHELCKNPFNTNHRLYKRLQVAFFPKEKLTAQDILDRTRQRKFFCRGLPVHRDQMQLCL